ncbi:MAG: UDP-N-acetylmuramoyl-tripeptide--D-alanyl-D-alanine ligase [Bacteroidales bacterium]|nr:UDP-N-acetylmuramoyl-tripeptide--D-alanyl-D-alanine ligase [Bacteroidales bacterium]
MDLYDLFLQHPVVTTDSRSCPEGSLFFALKGDKFNANAFAADALAKGCSYAVIDDARYATDDRCIVVADVLKALQELATLHRKSMPAKIIGITGSNGKTTTKELIAAVLKQRFDVLYTQGNLNNHIGVPLTLLQLRPHHQLAIIEMGANHPGEIQLLSSIARPDFGIITNVGKAHLEGFGSFEGVKQTKAELYRYIAGEGLAIFINRSNAHLAEMAGKAGIDPEKQIGYTLGVSDDPACVSGEITANDPLLKMKCHTGDEVVIQTNLIGAYNAENVLAAVAIGQFFGLSGNEIKQGLEAYQPTNNRSQLTITAHNQLVVDAYNANPSSMQAAIQNFSMLEASCKTLILGDMLELGNDSRAEHQTLVNLLKEKKLTRVYLVGNEFQSVETDYPRYATVEALQEVLSAHPVRNCLILIKGSRGIQLEKIIPFV